MMAAGDLDLSAYVRRTDTVLWGQGTAEPRTLTRAFVDQRAELRGVHAMLGVSYSDTLQPEHADHIRFTAFGGYGTNARLSRAGVLDVIPLHISTVPSRIRSGELPVDVAFIQVSPADARGRHCLGLAADYLQAAVSRARVVIAEVHEDVPRTCGETAVEATSIDVTVEAAEPPLELPAATPNDDERTIADYIAERIPHGAVLQFGIGSIPDAVCAALVDKRDLGIHSGMIGEGVVDLIEAGAVTNRTKALDPGISIGGVLFGSRRLYRFADDNPSVELRSIDYTHATSVIARLESFVSIHTALEVDLTGQVNAETLDGVHVGAVGGSHDFVRGAAASHGGTSIIALRSSARGGTASRIVPSLRDGVVTTPRSDVDLVVTEFGVAELQGRSLRQRAESLTAIAHPDFRALLSEAAEGVC
jgi:acyl-CoA hydrolase